MLLPPEVSPSPRVIGNGATSFTTRFAAGAIGTSPSSSHVYGHVGGRGTPPSLTLSTDKSKMMEVECHIPTPFELFRLYDTDANGRVAQEEFFSMLCDMDSHPSHYAPHEDPEHRLVGLREKRYGRQVM